MGIHKYYLMLTKNLSVEAEHYKCSGNNVPVSVMNYVQN